MLRITSIVSYYNEEEIIEIFYGEVALVMKALSYQFDYIYTNNESKDQIVTSVKRINSAS